MFHSGDWRYCFRYLETLRGSAFCRRVAETGGPADDRFRPILTITRPLRKGGKCEFAAPARASRQRHESSHSRLRLDVSPCCTTHQRQQCAGSVVCKVVRPARGSRHARPIAAVQAQRNVAAQRHRTGRSCLPQHVGYLLKRVQISASA